MRGGEREVTGIPGSQRTGRREQLAGGLHRVRARVAAAAATAGRDPAELVVVVVTKFFPAADVADLLSLGVHDFGENRHPEAQDKFAEVRAAVAGSGGEARAGTLHFIGQIQTNKAAAIARYADVVHAVDRRRLVQALDRGGALAGRVLRALVQVDLDPNPDPGRGGVGPADVLELADQVAAAEHLQLGGVMAVAPLAGDPDEAFARLADVAARVRARHPGADWISAGMSTDLESAVRHGATHLRVGTAILGSRPPLR